VGGSNPYLFELTPTYLSWSAEEDSAARRLSEIAPDCNLICCLRNPVDRAYSQWKYWGEEADPFEEAVKNNYVNILGRGLYAKHLKRWFQYFSSNQFLIQFHGEVVDNNARAVREVYTHLGVDPEYRPSWIGQAYNAVVLPRIHHVLRRLGLAQVIQLVRGTSLGTWIRQWVHESKQSNQAKHSEMSSEVRKKLVDYYAQPNEELEALLGVDLSHWNE